MKKMIYFEDLSIGQKIKIGPISVTEKEIIEFAKKYDPQPFHIDAEKAKDSLFGGLCASGWHTCSLYMRMLYDGLLVNLASLGSPGMNQIRWIKPLFPNDTINGELEIISKKLDNKSFVERAPKHIVEQEKNTYNELKSDIDKINLTIKSLA